MTRWWVVLTDSPYVEDGWSIFTSFVAVERWVYLWAEEEDYTAWPLEALL